MDEDVRSQASVDAVVTVVDAKHRHQHWDADEAIEQLAFADVILLNFQAKMLTNMMSLWDLWRSPFSRIPFYWHRQQRMVGLPFGTGALD